MVPDIVTAVLAYTLLMKGQRIQCTQSVDGSVGREVDCEGAAARACADPRTETGIRAPKEAWRVLGN